MRNLARKIYSISSRGSVFPSPDSAIPKVQDENPAAYHRERWMLVIRTLIAAKAITTITIIVTVTGIITVMSAQGDARTRGLR